MYRILIPALAFVPTILFAAVPSDLKGLVNIIIDILELLITITFALSIFTIIFGVVKGWIIEGGSPEGIESGKKYAVFGIIALAVMSSVWGLVQILRNTLTGG